MTREHAEKVYAILEEHGFFPKESHPSLTKEDLIDTMTAPHYSFPQERLLNASNPLGFGAKVHIDPDGVVYVSYYSELHTPAKGEAWQNINSALKPLNNQILLEHAQTHIQSHQAHTR
jgi:hypothetical protein